MTREQIYKQFEHYLKYNEPSNIVLFSKALVLAMEMLKSDAKVISRVK